MQAFPAVFRRLLLVLLCLSAGTDPAQLQGERGLANAHVLACPTCEGSGNVEAPCWYCRGEKRTCTQSGYRKPPYPRRWQAAWLPDAWWHLIQELAYGDRGEWTASQQSLVRHLGERAERPEPAGQRTHEVPCVAGCEGGELPLGGEWVDCRLCTQGRHACPTCKKRPPRCPPCEGSGLLSAACPDCAGKGTLADPRRTDPVLCPWSGNASVRVCGSCDDDGRVTLPCRSCGGHGRLWCKTCQGLGKVACPGCLGRGRLQSGNCVACNKQGFLSCLACDAGSQPCDECSGSRTIIASCPHCGGSKKHACNGCAAGSYAAWEHAASWCLELQRPDRAVVLLEAALERCEARYRATSYPPQLSQGNERFDPFLFSLLGRGGKATRLEFEEAREEERLDELNRLRAFLRKARLAAR